MISPGALVWSKGTPRLFSCVAEPFNFPTGACAWLKSRQLCFVVAVHGEWICIFAPRSAFEERMSDYPIFVWIYVGNIENVPDE